MPSQHFRILATLLSFKRAEEFPNQLFRFARPTFLIRQGHVPPPIHDPAEALQDKELLEILNQFSLYLIN